MRKSMLGFLCSRVGVSDSTSGRFTLKCQFFLGTLVLLLLSFSAPLAGQVGRSGISGTVTDPTGAVVPGVQVTAENEATNQKWSTTSGTAGVYFIRNLPVGLYTVTAEVPGFQRSIITQFQTEVEKMSSLDFTLTVGAVTQEITVEATPTLLTETSGTIGNLVTRKEIETLPLNGRSWISLNFLTPGAVKFQGQSSAFSDITGTVSPGNVVVNGLRGGNNKYFIDGVSLENSEDQILGILPPLEAIQEFRTQTGNMTAEFISGAGAAISATIKSGTNEIHGSVWEFLRNDALDARNFFDLNQRDLSGNEIPDSAHSPFETESVWFCRGWSIKKRSNFLVRQL